MEVNRAENSVNRPDCPRVASDSDGLVPIGYDQVLRAHHTKVYASWILALAIVAPAAQGVSAQTLLPAFDPCSNETAQDELNQEHAEQGSSIAQFLLGLSYATGGFCYRQDYFQAIRWYRKAAQQGHSAAQNNLGYMYANGRGVPQSYSDALEWYTKAAEGGFTLAQFNLGRVYAYGRGVKRDYVRAHMWTNLAAIGGDERAVAARTFLASQMSPAQIAEAQRLAREWRLKPQAK